MQCLPAVAQAGRDGKVAGQGPRTGFQILEAVQNCIKDGRLVEVRTAVLQKGHILMNIVMQVPQRESFRHVLDTVRRRRVTALSPRAFQG